MSDLSGVDFNFSFAPGVTDEQVLGFELAGDIWSQHLIDTYQGEDLDINIHVEIGDDILPENIIGGAFPNIKTDINYSEIRDALINDVTSELDQQVVDNLLGTNSIDILVGEEVVEYNYKMNATTANLKALGLIDGNSQELDGYIVMNSLANAPVSWDYNYLGAPEAGKLDFLSTALHEIGHSIGFISGLDSGAPQASSFLGLVEDYIVSDAAAQGGSFWEQVGNFFDFAKSDAASVTQTTIMDLFRVSVASAALDTITATAGEVASISFDGAFTDWLLSTGVEFDFQASHWINRTVDDGLGLMNPTLGLGERWSISEKDLSVLDAIGWDVDYTAEINLEKLFDNAQMSVDNALVVDRTADVNEILHTESYNWAWRSSGASTGGWWWAWRSSGASTGGWWQTGYWATYESATGEVAFVGSSSDDNESDSWWNKDSENSSWWNNLWWNDNSWGDHSWWGSNHSDDDDDDDHSWWSSNHSDDDDNHSWWSSNHSDDDNNHSWWNWNKDSDDD